MGEPPALPTLCDHSGERRTSVTGLGPDPEPIWESVLEVLRGQLPKPTFESLVAKCRLLGVDGNVAIVLTQSKGQADIMERRQYQAIYKAMNGVLQQGEDLEVQFVWEATDATR